MSTATITLPSNEDAFYRNRKANLVYPIIVFPFITALFWILGGGKGERYLAEEQAAGRAGASGFNANIPTAKNGSINGREVETPGYGKAVSGQVLSVFGNTRQDSLSKGLKAIPAITETPLNPVVEPASSLVAGPTVPSRRRVSVNNSAAVAVATQGKQRPKGGKPYYYSPPGASTGYYTGAATDQQLAAQLRDYQNTRSQPASSLNVNQPRSEAISSQATQQDTKAATVQVSDNLTATRLDEPMNPADAFYTAPTEGSRRRSQRAVLSGGNSYGSKKTVAWMIPVVVHEDQAIKEGQQVKLRLTREIAADGITIPANTILYAVCNLADDRLRLSVRSLQLGGQLIPLDLDVYDTDGSPGINVPGLSTNSQMGGQMRSSAIQGVQVPGVGGLGNAVLSSARMGASNSMRQSTIRLRAGYNLFLKAQ